MRKRKRSKRRLRPGYRKFIIGWRGVLLLLFLAGLMGFVSMYMDKQKGRQEEAYISAEPIVTLADIPGYSGHPYIAINNNVPRFKDTELDTTSHEFYSELDALGRCGVAYACIGVDIMPVEERGNIGHVKPTGWSTVKYNNLVDGNYLYNRCHLIGFQLTGENANERNLITGTRYLNVEGMLPFENMVADYVKETENHVMYRVTPIFEADNLVASGVLIEAKSVEDDGEGILFCVYCYNVQPGIVIDYTTGDSAIDENQENQTMQEEAVIANKNSNTYHTTGCEHLPKEKNRIYFNSEREANAARYDNPCNYCNP